MRLFLIISLSLVTFLGCTHKNAFDRFDMTQERERSEESIQSSKVMNKESAYGVVTAVHLNKAYPELYKDAEYFYIYLNIDGDDKESVFELNGSKSMLVEELNNTNEFTKITHFDAEWKRYYLVGFKKEEGKLNLSLKYDNTTTLFTFKNE